MTRLPLIVLVLFGLGLGKMAVAGVAATLGDLASCLTFAKWGGATIALAIMITLARQGGQRRGRVTRESAALVVVYLVAPALSLIHI